MSCVFPNRGKIEVERERASFEGGDSDGPFGFEKPTVQDHVFSEISVMP